MELKRYQNDALRTLGAFLTKAAAVGPAKAFADAVADQDAQARLEGRKPLPRSYKPLEAMPDVPYVCLRLPTGGGKTILAAEAIGVAAAFMRTAYPLTLWMVPSDTIKTQTLEALKTVRHPYRQRLDAVFGGRVRVFDIAEFDTLRPQDLARSTCVVVATIQAFRVEKTSGRKVYSHHEELEPHFSALPTEGMEVVSTEEAVESAKREGAVKLKAGAVKFSFANLCFHHRPLMIVDEAHNAVSGLSRVVQERVRPAAIIELTATPKHANNLLFSITATALKDEEMIKLPIRVKAHDGWQEAVSGAVATRNMLEEKAKKEAEHLRPIVLYQAQAKNGHPTVAEVREFLIKEKIVPEAQIKVATGEQRELDGVNLSDPGEHTRHVITVQALKEGWDCPSAYVLCATQRLTAATAVEQLLGRVLRMPYAKRRRDEALNSAYAHVSEPSFIEAVKALREKLIDMGFTDEEIRESLKPRSVEPDAQGELIDPDPVDPKPVLSYEVPDTPEARRDLQDSGTDYFPMPGGALKVGVRGALTAEVATAIERHVPEAARAHFAATVAAHRAKVEVEKSPAEKGAAIEVPFLFVEFEGDAFLADGEKILERVEWSLLNHPAEITEAELDFRRSEQFIEIDIDGEKLVFSQGAERVAPRLGLSEPSDIDLEATLVQWLERHCRAAWLPPEELSAWLAKLVVWMTTARGVPVRTLIDWQYPLATKIRSRIDAIRRSVRVQAHQRALFDDLAVVRADPAAIARFDADSYRTVPTQSTGAFRLKKHLLGPSRIALLDGDLGGEEFQCAYTLDNLGSVDLWVRNLPRHPASFWLPKADGRFYPDFVARLTDGRLCVVEYKGAHLVGAPDEKEKTLLGNLWARKSGNVFVTAQRMLHGVDVAGQIRQAIANASR